LLLTLVALAAAGLAARSDAARRNRVTVDPVGSWNCVIYGHPAFGDERVLLDFGSAGRAQIARLEDGEINAWEPLSVWAADDDAQMTFADPRSGRRFEANLARTTLGGHWRTYTLLGGWWCSAAKVGTAPALDQPEPEPRAVMPPLLPMLTATPQYPLQAIRDAKQGRAVSCFFVDPNGYIVRPELIELSDEVFRQPILNALSRSRYQVWDDDDVMRPGCRSFIFKLDTINATAAVD
jgi:hypothetical protein